MAQAEDVIDGTGRIGRMFADRDAALVIQQAVDDVRGLAGMAAMTLLWKGAKRSET